MRSTNNKLYVNVKTGVVYHKPVKVNGVIYEPPKSFYEITEEQAGRIAAGETLRAVLRDGIREKVESELNGTMPEDVKEEETAPESDDLGDNEVEGLSTHKQVDEYAASKDIEIPEDCTTIQAKKDFINTVLLVG